MKPNMGQIDKTLRLIAAAVIAVLLIIGVIKGTVAIVLAIIGAIFVITTFVGLCPAYVPFKISTRGKRDKKNESCEV
jgi:uncharacterized membrane protein